MASAPIASGGLQPRSGFGYDRSYQDGIFIRSQFMDTLNIKARENEMKIVKLFGERLGAGKSKPGERFMIPTVSNPAVGDVTDTVTTSSYGYPDYIATDSPTITQTNDFSRKIAAGTTVLGIGLPMQAPNEGQVELIVNQHRGAAMIFTKRFLETAMGFMKDPSGTYSSKMKYSLNNDAEEYFWLSWLYTGPITATAGDYGTGLNSFTDAIGITNQSSYQLTRTLTAIGTGSNLVTPTSTGTSAVSFSNSGNARFSTYNVPWSFGSTSADISFDVLARLEESFNKRNVPMEGRAILCEPKGYNDIAFLPQFSNRDYKASTGDVYSTGRVGGQILTFAIDMTNVIQPAGASSNVLYEIAGVKGSLLYEFGRETELIMDNRLNKPEMCQIVMATNRYGGVVQRPDHTAVLVTRTRT
ncbi:MAG: hypothetical protein E6Q97_16165 [Desulfurellales bacterium]|nr:MAG: hypothetical protein E6Q97_16165 [Desulfurellales bacterium]